MGTWETVRNLIVKIDSTSRISDEFKQRKLKKSGAAAGVKACRACGKKGHMAAACMVPKSQLKCKFCEYQNSHNMAACLKKKKQIRKKMMRKVGIKRIKRIQLLRKQLLRTEETIPIPIKEIFP